MLKRIVFILAFTVFFQVAYCQVIQLSNAAFPSLPDSSRIVYVTKISSSYDIERKQSWLSKFILGEESAITFSKPNGICLHKSKIYVCDPSNGLYIIDMENKTFKQFTGNGVLQNPVKCTFDEFDNLYIADRGRKEVIIFNQDLSFKGSFGKGITPVEIKVYKDRIWVTNYDSRKTEIYERNAPYTKLGTFPNIEQGEDGHLSYGMGIDIYNDTVYISDAGLFDVKAYTLNGDYIRSFGAHGTQAGTFARPKGIAIDNEGILHVVDAAFENVQMFNRNAKILMFYGGHYEGPGYLYLPYDIDISYDLIPWFSKYISTELKVNYLIFVTNNYGPDAITVYARIEPALIEKVEEIQKSKKRRKKRKKDSGPIKF